MGMITAEDQQEIVEVITKAVTSAIATHHLTCPIRDVQAATELNTEGVNNFRKFQLDVTGKMNFVHGAAKAWTVILGLAFTVIIALSGWLFQQIYPAFRAIMVDYYSHHPDTKMENKTVHSINGEVYTVRVNPPLDATIDRPDMQSRP